MDLWANVHSLFSARCGSNHQGYCSEQMEDPTHLLAKEGEGSKNDLGFFLSLFFCWHIFSVCNCGFVCVCGGQRSTFRSVVAQKPFSWFLFFFFKKKIRFYVFYLCVYVYLLCLYITYGWRAACGSRLSYHLGPGNLTQAARPGRRWLYPLRHLAGLHLIFWNRVLELAG